MSRMMTLMFRRLAICKRGARTETKKRQSDTPGKGEDFFPGTGDTVTGGVVGERINTRALPLQAGMVPDGLSRRVDSQTGA